eukprot:1148840-Pelagomonas_calceolata.AAC.2
MKQPSLLAIPPEQHKATDRGVWEATLEKTSLQGTHGSSRDSLVRASLMKGPWLIGPMIKRNRTIREIEETLPTSSKKQETHRPRRAVNLLHHKATDLKVLMGIWRVTGSIQLQDLAVGMHVNRNAHNPLSAASSYWPFGAREQLQKMHLYQLLERSAQQIDGTLSAGERHELVGMSDQPRHCAAQHQIKKKRQASV